ncbi:MAG: hypothetical protein JO200_21200 [Comamonas sp.]|nr:hypothetical protein [Comamonas sp.]
MADQLYPKGKEKILRAQVNFDNDTIKAVLVSSDYAFAGAHEFLTHLGAAVVGEAVALANKSSVNGAFGADDPLFLALPAGQTAKAMVVYKDTGVAGTSALLGYFDNITGFPAVTNGGDLLVRISTGPYRLFSL